MKATGGNQHKQCPCPYCWSVYYSKGALTAHINAKHWVEKKEEAEMLKEKTNE